LSPLPSGKSGFILDAATTQPDQFYNSPWFTTLVGFGGVIVGAVIAGVIGFRSVRYAASLEATQEKEKAIEELRTRREALNVELEYMLDSISEVKNIPHTPETSTKRLNWDFLEACRLDWYKTDSDVVFIKALAKAYRDVVYTNAQIDNYVDWSRTLALKGELYSELIGSSRTFVLKSLEATETSVGELKKLNELKVTQCAGKDGEA
jgi:hypothetical protein